MENSKLHADEPFGATVGRQSLEGPGGRRPTPAALYGGQAGRKAEGWTLALTRGFISPKGPLLTNPHPAQSPTLLTRGRAFLEAGSDALSNTALTLRGLLGLGLQPQVASGDPVGDPVHGPGQRPTNSKLCREPGSGGAPGPVAAEERSAGPWEWSQGLILSLPGAGRAWGQKPQRTSHLYWPFWNIPDTDADTWPALYHELSPASSLVTPNSTVCRTRASLAHGSHAVPGSDTILVPCDALGALVMGQGKEYGSKVVSAGITLQPDPGSSHAVRPAWGGALCTSVGPVIGQAHARGGTASWSAAPSW